MGVSVDIVNRPAELILVCYFSVCVCNFTCRPDETYALVGTAKDLTLNPRSCAGGFIHTYKIAELIDGGYKLEFVHKVSTCFQALHSYSFNPPKPALFNLFQAFSQGGRSAKNGERKHRGEARRGKPLSPFVARRFSRCTLTN